MNGNPPASLSPEQDYAWSLDNESFNYQSLGDLIDTHQDDIEVGQVVYVGFKVEPDPATFFDADDLVERLGEVAYDRHGECAEDWPDVTKAAKAQFNNFLAAWMAEHCPVRFYSVKNVRSYTVTAEDLK